MVFEPILDITPLSIGGGMLFLYSKESIDLIVFRDADQRMTRDGVSEKLTILVE